MYEILGFKSSWSAGFFIRKTCPCKVYPLEPHFYIAKLGYAGVYLFFLFLLQNIDCGYSLEPPRRGGSNEYPQSMFWSKNKKNIKTFLMKFSFFATEKNLYILHGQVFVMCSTLSISHTRRTDVKRVKSVGVRWCPLASVPYPVNPFRVR